MEVSGSRGPPVYSGESIQNRQGGKMLFADPLSRVCGPTEGWYDPSLPRKLAALFEHLPNEVRNNPNLRVYAGKDTYAAGRLLQKWRKPSNRISQGKLLTKDGTPDTFHIGVDDVNKCVKEVRQLVKENKSFAIRMPVSITSEIARMENKDGQRCHDNDLAIKVSTMSKITLASSSEVWLINLPGEPFNHFLSNDMEGLGLTGCQEVFQESLAREKEGTASRHLHFKEVNEPDCADPIEEYESRDESPTLDAFLIYEIETSRRHNRLNTSRQQHHLRREGHRRTRNQDHNSSFRESQVSLEECSEAANTRTTGY
jgi:hypothetical protein